MHISLDSAIGQQRRLNQVGETINSIAAPAAAYSLRSLTGGDPKVVRVRRESDNTERDFTASDVNSGALVDFVNSQTVKPLDVRLLNTGTGERDGLFQIASAAYSLRSLGDRQATVAATGDTVTAANGKYVVQVRRSSDDTIKSFTADEVSDGTLVAFVGSGNDGFVRTWYDQSVTDQGGGTATGNHATQTTAASQPKIVSSGALVVDSAGLPEIDFDGSNDCLTASSYSRSGEDLPLTMISVFDQDVEGVDYIVALTQSDNNSFDRILLRADDFEYGRRDVANSSKNGAGSDPDVNTKYVFTAINTGTTSSGFVNGSSIFSGVNTNVGTQALDQIDIGANNGDSASNANPFDGKIQEIIIYETDQEINRGAYEGNIADHYSITGVPTGANTVDGFVETWYDQSGNGNDVTQTTSTKQPKIVSSGSLVTVNSKASFKFDGTDDFLERETYTQGTLSQPNTFFSVAELDAYADENRKVYDSHLSTARNMLQLNTVGNGQFAHFAGTVVATGEDADADRHLFTSLLNGANSRLRIDSTQKSTANPNTTAMTGIVIGANHDIAQNFWDGDIQELIVYNSDQTSNFTALEANINSHYSIF